MTAASGTVLGNPAQATEVADNSSYAGVDYDHIASGVQLWSNLPI